MAPPRLDDIKKGRPAFVGRVPEKRIFEQAAHAIPDDRAILRVFHGMGGQGKTALREELMRMCAADPSYRYLRRAVVDLRGRTKSEPDLLLVWIRNEFARAGLSFPCFDLALAIVWEGTRGEQAFPTLVNPWLGKATKGAKQATDAGSGKAADWLNGEIAGTVAGEVIGAIPGLGWVFKTIGHWVIDKSKRAWLEHTRDHMRRLYGEGGALRPVKELSGELPWMLARDLNHHLRHNPAERFALLFDEYESVFDQSGTGRRWGENPFDAHVRAFVQETNGLLAVFFSREKLPWADDPDWRDDLTGAQHPVGGLSETEALALLASASVADADAAIRDAILAAAREGLEEDATYYPLLLILLVEHGRALAAKGVARPEDFALSADSFAGKCREIVDRILRDYDFGLQATVERLAFLRRFDKETFAFIVREFGTAVPHDLFDRLAKLSFVDRADDGGLTIHTAVAEAIRESLDDARREDDLRRLFAHFEERARVANHLELDDGKIAALFEAAHLRSQLNLGTYVDWLDGATRHLRDGARHQPAHALWVEALAISEKKNGPEHRSTGVCSNNLASLLHHMGDYAGAKPLYERSLAISEKVSGPEHPSTGTRLNNLAGLLRAMGDHAGARPLFERSLAISEQTEGPEHPSTGTRLNNLASLLQDMGDYAGAKPLFERSLAISEQTEGPEHPSTGTSLNNLALLMKDMGDHTDAKPLYERALAISERANGPEHPSTGVSLNNLAALLHDMGDHADAKPLYERALAISERANGPVHPSTGVRLNNLASLLYVMGDYAGAKPLYERALTISEKAEGPEHPSTGTSLNNLAVLLRAMGDYAGSKPLLERALTISEKAEGPEHPSTGTSLNNLASLLYVMGDHAGAKPLLERALGIFDQSLGYQHPSTRTIRTNLATLLDRLGDHAGAQALRSPPPGS